MVDSTSEIARREAAIGTGRCADCEGPTGPDEALCLGCREPRRARVPEINPYRRVWNTVEDEEAQIVAAVRNNALFVPTPDILAERHRATARHLRARAAVGRVPSPWSAGRGAGGGPGRKAAKEAAIHDRLAAHLDRYGQRIKQLKRPRDFSFTVIEEI